MLQRQAKPTGRDSFAFTSIILSVDTSSLFLDDVRNFQHLCDQQVGWPDILQGARHSSSSNSLLSSFGEECILILPYSALKFHAFNVASGH
jgi:hypothetical protein